MRRVPALACLGFLGMSLWGDVVTNASCAAYGDGATSGVAQCAQGSGIAYATGPEARAAVSAVANLPLTPAEFALAGITEYVSEVPAPGSNGAGSSSAAASAEIRLNLSTDGPVRAGLLEVELSAFSWIDAPEGYSGQMNLAIGSVTVSCQSTGHAVCASGGYYIGTNNALFLPFTLGQSFTFDFAQNATVNGDLFSGASEGRDQTAIAFRFLEADGSTPAGMYDPPTAAPEPGTWGIVALGVLGFALWKGARRSAGGSIEPA